MNKSILILRWGLAITFLWIGFMIWQNPEAWGGYIKPWAADLIPVPIEQVMKATAVLDIVIGLMFLVGPLVWIGGILGALHLAVVLVTSGITDITVRDIGLLAATLSIAVNYWPQDRK
ncbi:MAG: DoxX family membrane protein [Parcubacteria group bacterium]|nr:DoxX family membrane protein [Parcubacteria group bacterium]